MAKGIDPNRLEYYLSDDEFLKVFQVRSVAVLVLHLIDTVCFDLQCTKAQYEAMPTWKAVKAKKERNLF